MMNKEKRKNDNSSEMHSDFELRDLDEYVLARIQEKADRESEMIANFNAKVNKVGIAGSPASSSKDNDKKIEKSGDSKTANQLEPTRYGDWEKKGRCYDF